MFTVFFSYRWTLATKAFIAPRLKLNFGIDGLGCWPHDRVFSGLSKFATVSGKIGAIDFLTIDFLTLEERFHEREL